MPPVLSPVTERAPAPPEPAQSRRAPVKAGLLALAALYGVAVVVYAVLGSRQPIPIVAPDEFTYAHLASSLAHGRGMTWNGTGFSLSSALYVYAITPIWGVFSGTDAYAVTKVFGSTVVCLVALPVWLLTRRLTEERTALIAAALTLAGVWMTAAGFVMTEVFAIPLGVSALAAMVVALQEPGRRWAWVAIGISAVGAWSRMQLVVLFPIFVLALLLDCARSGSGWRDRLRAHRNALIALVGIMVLGVAILLADRSGALGLYSTLTNQHATFSHMLSRMGETGVGLIALTAFLPAALCLGFAQSSRAWRDDALGPLLIVGLVASVAFTVQSGWFVARQPAHWHIDRYVAYPAVLLVITAVIGARRGFVRRGPVALASAVLIVFSLLMPGLGSALEERAYYTSILRLEQLFGTGDQVSLAIAAGLMALGGIFVISRVRSPMAVTALAVVIGAGLVAQSEAGWRWQIDVTRAARVSYPADLDWLRHDAGPGHDVAQLVTGYATPESRTITFFNPEVSRVYGVPKLPTGANGMACTWDLTADGHMVFTPACGPTPRKLYLDTLGTHLAIRDERVLGDHGPLARVVSVPADPRLIAYIARPCGRIGPVNAPSLRTVRIKRSSDCSGVLGGYVFADGPATLRLAFRGGTRDHYVAIDGTPHRIPAGVSAEAVDVAIARDQRQFQISEDWTNSAGAPDLVRADLLEANHSQRVY